MKKCYHVCDSLCKHDLRFSDAFLYTTNIALILYKLLEVSHAPTYQRHMLGRCT